MSLFDPSLQTKDKRGSLKLYMTLPNSVNHNQPNFLQCNDFINSHFRNIYLNGRFLQRIWRITNGAGCASVNGNRHPHHLPTTPNSPTHNVPQNWIHTTMAPKDQIQQTGNYIGIGNITALVKLFTMASTTLVTIFSSPSLLVTLFTSVLSSL